jgi:phosphoribosylformylglycinamidine synthase PurS subunit
MIKFRADVTVLPKDGVLDTQGKAVQGTLNAHGYETVDEVRVGKFIRLTVEAESESRAGELVRAMAGDLLVNDLVESYTFSLAPLQ